MLNFHWPAVPFAFAIWGFAVGRFRRRLLHRQAGDARFFITAVCTMLCLWGWVGDLDIVWAYIVRYVLLPAVMVRLVSVREPAVIRHAPSAP